MKLPTHNKIIEWYKEIDTPNHILDHVKLVNKIANFLAKKLYEKNIKLNLEVIDKASLAHDLDKWLCINDKSIKHGFKTEEILIEKGYPEIGYYARQHRGDLIVHGLKTWEEKIIAYSDKRVQENKIVTLDNRFKSINKRYPAKNIKLRKKQISLFYELEKEIFSKLDLKPQELEKFIN